MRRRPRASGYALLAALVMVALAATITATCIVAVGAHQNVSAADVSATAARAAIQDALSSFSEQVRWAPGAHSGVSHAEYSPGGSWTATWWAGDRAPSGFGSLTLDVTSVVGASRGALRAVVEMRAEPCAQGVVVAGDVELQAPLRVIGSGIYSGGCLSGREWLSFGAEGAATTAVDDVHPDLWPLAAVHALGSIWADGEEIHAQGSALPVSPWADDSDTHTDQGWPAEFLSAPGPELMCALGEHSIEPGDALASGVLDLSLLPSRDPFRTGEAADPEGYIVLVRPEGDTALLLVGRRPADACPITLIVEGDAALGRPGSPETLGLGALVVAGRLEVRGPAHYIGHLFAERLTVMAPTVFEAPSDWRAHPLPGLVTPVIVALSKP